MSTEQCILLVDDNRHLLVTLSDFLTYEGYRVESVSSAEAAIKCLERFTPDLVILDISMPGMGGLGFLTQITDEQGNPRYPVLVFTARTSMEEFFDSLNVNGFVSKPCSEAELLREVRSILSASRKSVPSVQVPLHRILIGEDDHDRAAALKRRLENEGYQVTCVDSGAEVLEMAASDPPSLVMVKEILPGMNGRVVVPLIRAMPSTKKVPILLYDDTQEFGVADRFSRRLPDGVTEFLKTGLPAELVSSVKQLLKE